MSKVGDNIKALRSAFGLTKTDLARIMRVTRQQVGRWESGHAKPQTANLRGIAGTFGLTVEDLLYGDATAIRDARLAPYLKIELERWPTKSDDVRLSAATDEQLLFELAHRMRLVAVQFKSILDEAESYDWANIAQAMASVGLENAAPPRSLRPAIKLVALLQWLNSEWPYKYSPILAAHQFHSELPGAEMDPDEIDMNTLHGRFASIWGQVTQSKSAIRLLERCRREYVEPLREGDLISEIKTTLEELRESGVDTG